MGMANEQKTVACGIEHHAVLYALLVKEAIGQWGKAGEKAARDGTARYGRERGARMAQAAIANGDELSLPNYRLYKEWRPPEKGMQVEGPSQNAPSYVSTVFRCEWVESWKRNGLLEYGKMYCQYVDRYLYKGWSEQYELKISTLLSNGDDRCTFDWGYEMTEEIKSHMEQRSKEIGAQYVKDFNYHTGHLLCALRSEFAEQLGSKKAQTVCEAALQEFARRFGQEYVQAVKQGYVCETLQEVVE